MALIRRLLRATFKLADRPIPLKPTSFAESGTNQVTVDGLRMSATVVKAGGNSMSSLDITIYGMTLSLMNQLATLGMIYQLVPKNTILLEAGDADSMGTVFAGTIISAYADFQGAPEVGFVIHAATGGIEAVLPTPPTSFSGPVDIVSIMSGLAAQNGWTFENDGVTGKAVFPDPYFSGSGRDQVLAAAAMAGISWIFEDGDIGARKLVIWPKGGTRDKTAVPVLSPDTGMVGYPTFTAQGIMVKTLYNPSISFGGSIKVANSALKQANGTWTVQTLAHNLDSLVPNGQWFSTVQAFNPKFPTPIPQGGR